MEGHARRHSFVDLLERVSDGVHVSFVDRTREPDRGRPSADRVSNQRDRNPEKPRQRNRR